MKFEVGDKVVMSRDSEYYRESIVDSSGYEKDWWSELEEVGFLTVSGVRNVYDHLQYIKLEDFDYIVASTWLKPYSEA